MNRTIPLLCLLTIVGCAPAMGETPAATVPAGYWKRNLVANPGFELDANGDGAPDGWALPPGQCAWETAAPAAGKRCLRFTNTDPKNYRLVTAPVRLIPGLRYRISARVKAKDVHDGDVHQDGAGLCIEWVDAQGKWLGGHYPSCRGGTFDWTALDGETGPVPEKAARGNVVLYLRKNNVGTAWFDDVEVRAIRGPLLAVRLLRPAYRATAEMPTSGKTVEVEVRVNRREHAIPSRGARLQAAVTGADDRPFGGLPPQALTEGDEPVSLSWRLPELVAGDYTLTCRLLGRDGEALGEDTTPLRVARPRARKVTLDERGRLIVEGKPFFPLGVYLGPTDDEHLERIAKGGFNTILCYGYGVGKEPKAYLDRAQRHGLKVVYSVKDFYDDTRWFPKSGGKKGIELTRHYVTQFRGHPALLAWYTNDELGPKHMPGLQAAYDLVCELDPDHPAFQVLCRPGEFGLYYGVTDILGCDPYPIPRHPVTLVDDWMETSHRAMSHRKPVWCVPQIFQWANYSKKPTDREPTFAEKRAMIFLALIHRANGLICYSYYDLLKNVDEAGFARRWKEVSTIATEVKNLIPVLLDGKELAVGHTDPIRYRILGYAGGLHVLAVNTSAAEAGVAIPLPRGTVPVRGGASPRIADGKLLDTLKPLETGNYVIK